MSNASRFLLASILSAFALSACAAKKPTQPTEIRVLCDSDKGDLQGLLIGEQRIGNLADSASTETIRKLLPDRNQVVRITSLADTPYRCLGGAIFVLQRLGYQRVTFIAAPPPSNSR